MDLHGWLLNLGLQQYEAAFRENDIDETLLPSLTAQDLKDIGVGVVGHRRKLLNAIGACPVIPSPHHLIETWGSMPPFRTLPSAGR